MNKDLLTCILEELERVRVEYKRLYEAKQLVIEEGDNSEDWVDMETLDRIERDLKENIKIDATLCIILCEAGYEDKAN